MNLKQELQKINDRLDKYRRKLDAAEKRGDQAIILQFKQEINALTKQITSVKKQQVQQLSHKEAGVTSLPYNRVLTKAEQADMGKLKKLVKGLVVVHPMTALGRQMGVTKVTGYAPESF